MIGCPCALVISIPLGYFGGIGAGSKQGILVKGSVFLDLLTQLKTVVMDKTGTMTKGVFAVQDVKTNGIDAPELARLTAALESKSTHPVATAILEYAGNEYETIAVADVEEIPGHGLRGNVAGRDMLVGNAKLLRKFNVAVDDALGKIATAINIGRATRRIVWQNIGLAMGVKAIVLVLGAGGLATMWEAVFADVGVALLAILNAVRVQNLTFK